MSAAQQVFFARVRPKRTRFERRARRRGPRKSRVRVLSFFSLHDSLPGYAHLWEENELHWSLRHEWAARLQEVSVILTLGCSPAREVGYRRQYAFVTASSGPCRTDGQSSRHASRRVLCKASTQACLHHHAVVVHRPASSSHAVVVDDAAPPRPRLCRSPRLTKRRRHGHARRQ